MKKGGEEEEKGEKKCNNVRLLRGSFIQQCTIP